MLISTKPNKSLARPFTGSAARRHFSALILCGGCLLLNTMAFGQGFSLQNKDATIYITTAYHPLRIRYYDDLLPQPDVQPGGAIDRLGDDYVGVTGAGAFFHVLWDKEHDSIRAKKLPISAPHDAVAFDAVADPVINREFFRVIDIVSRQTASGWQVFASHHEWLQDKNCLAMEISAIQLDHNLQPVSGDGGKWQTIYDTTPCLTLDTGNRGRIFAGHESGGRMAWLPNGKLLFTTGDQEHDGWNQPIMLAQSDIHMYGKTILVDPDKRTGKMYSKGQRNPQGLFVDKEGNIWESEHGPQGGDEINLIIKGKNYGWPLVTYGTDYGRYVWPPAKKVGDHSGYQQPVYAFVPSIGTSNLMRLDDTQFTEWKGDLLIAGLASQSLYRIRLEGKRVVYAEPISIKRRIRDLIVGPDKQIWLWGERGDLVSLSVGVSQDKGAILFQACAGCHTTGVTSGGLAPSLFRIVGRKMAVRTDFTYSDSFKSLDGIWTEEQLDKFLQDPLEFVPGTAMNNTKVTEPDDRRAIINYLKNMW